MEGKEEVGREGSLYIKKEIRCRPMSHREASRASNCRSESDNNKEVNSARAIGNGKSRLGRRDLRLSAWTEPFAVYNGH